jgi:hypothetical protein
MRFELTTLTLARLCSTPELRPRPWVRRDLVSSPATCKRKNATDAEIDDRWAVRRPAPCRAGVSLHSEPAPACSCRILRRDKLISFRRLQGILVAAGLSRIHLVFKGRSKGTIGDGGEDLPENCLPGPK